MKGIEYKKATIDDLPFISSLHKKNLQDFYTNDDLYWPLKAGCFDFYILLYNGKKAGCITLSHPDKLDTKNTWGTKENPFNILALVIKKSFQRKGIGCFAIRMAEKIAKQNNYKVIVAGSYMRYKVKNFYLKNNFKIIEECRDGEEEIWYWEFQKEI